MPQNIYDDAEFFAGYAQLPRSIDGLAGAAEWPAMRAMLPAMAGRRVLDLGCGYGWFCRWASAAGATSVLGLDVSEKMLERAQAEPPDATITYRRQDLDAVTLPEGTFDLVHSSLTLHYIADLPRLIGEVGRALVPGGAMVFSIEHPLYTAPSSPGFVTAASGHTTWPLDDYLSEGARTTDWITNGIVKYHRTIATYVNAIVAAGLVLDHLDEWGPTEEQIIEHPDWAFERLRPPFLLAAAHRPELF
jgi:SAM-dependent methyltransferase